MARQYNCVVCKKRVKPKDRRHISGSVRHYLVKRFFLNPGVTDVICNNCRQRYYVSETKAVPTSVQSDGKDQDYQPPSVQVRQKCMSSPPSVSLEIRSTPRSHARCVICKKPGPKLLVISPEARFTAFIEKNVLVAAESRCCPRHFETQDHLKPACLEEMATTDNVSMNRSSVVELLSQLRSICLKKDASLNFDAVENKDCINLTGLSKEQFDDLCQFIIAKVKATPSRSPVTTIGLFLFKLKSGISNKLISTIMKVSCSGVRRALKTIRRALMTSFVPLYLGLECVTREEIIKKHTRPLAKSLFSTSDNEMILVLDGTYIYVQKSNNFSFQRRSFSMHKSRPLVKPMVVVSTTGHFVTIVGPYHARNNDAAILNHMIKRNIDEFKDFVKENDLLIVDRGFRDSLALLEEMGIRAAMPTFLFKGQKQMTTEDANASRLVTKIRWVVESANARIKRFKYLDKVLPTNQIPYIGDYVRIVCAISNKYFPPLNACQNEDQDYVLARQMTERALQVNPLRAFVEENHLERRSAKWQSVGECDLPTFPRLTDEQLQEFTCGVYQLKLCPSYIQEHIDGDSEIHVHQDENDLLRVRIQSRHVSARKYLLWIRFCPTSILSWYCKCRAGARVVGVCAHIAAVVGFLSKGRYGNGRMGVLDWGTFLSNADTVDSSDSESGESHVEE